MNPTEHKGKPKLDRKFLAARIDFVLLYGTFALLMFGPLAFGAVEAWSIFVVEAGTLLLTLLWLAQQWISEEIEVHWSPLFLPMSVFACLVALQIVLGLSSYRHETISQSLLYCAYGMLCFLVTQTLRRTSQARTVAKILVIYGVIVAVFALVQGVAPNGKLYWLRIPRLGGRIYGPYVNHNHYAGLMEMLAPIPLVVSLSHFVVDKTRIAAGIAAAIMVGTIFLSGSRAGMLSISAEIAIVGIILFRQKRSLRLALGMGAFAIGLISLLVWLGGKELTSAVGSISTEARGEVSGGTRLSIDKDGLRMFSERPILGWGLGTFPVVYPHFRSFYTNFFVNAAHNDYLQLLDEMGSLGFATMLWFLFVVFRQSRKKIANWITHVGGGAALACSLGVVGILLHSFVDFNLQIPANAALFYVFCGILAAPPLLQRVRKPKPVTSEPEDLLATSQVV